MNNTQLQEFWQTLCELKGINLEEDLKQFNKKLNTIFSL